MGVACVWHACGMCVACVWHACGMRVACVWHACGMRAYSWLHLFVFAREAQRADADKLESDQAECDKSYLCHTCVKLVSYLCPTCVILVEAEKIECVEGE